MKQAQLFGGFTVPSPDNATTDGVAILTAQHRRLTLRTIKLSEQQVTSQIVQWLQTRGWTAHRKHVGEFVAYSRVIEALQKILDAQSDQKAVSVVKCMQDLAAAKVTLGRPGLPDWLFTHPKYPAMYVEMKATGQKPEPHQLAVLEQLDREGYFSTWTDDFSKFEAWYRECVAPKSAA